MRRLPSSGTEVATTDQGEGDLKIDNVFHKFKLVIAPATLDILHGLDPLLHPFVACAICEANIRPQVKSAHQWTKFNPLGMYCGKT
jgi:hypothetical protein